MVINKGDLVSDAQQADIRDKITLLNPGAKIVNTVQSRIKLKEILNTRRYETNKDKEQFWIKASRIASSSAR